MIDDIVHDFLLSHEKLVASTDVPHDVFIFRYFAVAVLVHLLKCIVNHLIAIFLIKHPLIREELVELVLRDKAILILINCFKLILQLLFHVICKAGLFNTHVNCVRI